MFASALFFLNAQAQVGEKYRLASTSGDTHATLAIATGAQPIKIGN
jgi:hypothetical protein